MTEYAFLERQSLDPTLILLETKRREAEDALQDIPDPMRQVTLQSVRHFYDLLVKRHLRGVYKDTSSSPAA